MTESVNLWRNADHAINYLEKRALIPRRADAYEVLFEIMPEHVERVLDLGTGDGYVLEMVLDARPGATGVGMDFQEEMLDRARQRFGDRPGVEIRRHDEFLSAIGSSPEQDDPSNKLVPVATHLAGLETSGFADAECLWKWRELAVVTGTKPA